MEIKTEGGMTLIEVIIGLAVVSIIGVAMLNLFSGGYKNMIETGIRANEVVKVSTIMEDMYAHVYGDGNELKKDEIKGKIKEALDEGELVEEDAIDKERDKDKGYVYSISKLEDQSVGSVDVKGYKVIIRSNRGGEMIEGYITERGETDG